MLQTGLALAGKLSELLNYGFQLAGLMPSKAHPQSYRVSLLAGLGVYKRGSLKKMAGSTILKKKKKETKLRVSKKHRGRLEHSNCLQTTCESSEDA